MWLLSFWLAAAFPAEAATGRVIKVLPMFRDTQGHEALSPSLYERDAYQFYLRQNPEKRSGMIFHVQWKAKGRPAARLLLRLELRGSAEGHLPTERILERTVEPGGWFSRWTSIPLESGPVKELGELSAWRATLWEGDRLLGEQKSFLW
ncbi:conserved exported hypothetical protein [Verrucomicrobia bacterium]|nr:conserved exported hypothetical protein [Verrucomicrobiota bacterium]